MAQPIRKKTVVAGLIAAAVLTVLGIAGLFFAHQWNADGDYAEQTAFMEMDVDLSRIGTYRGMIHHTMNRARVNVLTLKVEPPALLWDNHSLLTPFLGRYQVTGCESVEIEGSHLPRMNDYHRWVVPGPLAEVRLGTRGDFPFTLVVEQPVTALAGHKQKLLGRYDVREFQGVEAFLVGLMGFGSLVVGLIIGLPFIFDVRQLRREGRW